MSGMSTGYHHPYRTGPNPDAKARNVIEIETDDVEVTIHYLNIDDKRAMATVSYIGQPTAKEYLPRSDPNNKTEISKDSSRGTTRLDSWLRESFRHGYYEVGGLLIPTHRLLQISKVVKERKEKIEVVR